MVVEPLGVRQVDHEMRLDDVGDHRGEVVVIAELDFIDSHGVVLVDDRDYTPFQQGKEGIADVQEAFPVGEVAHREEDLADEETMLSEGIRVNPHQTALAYCRRRLLLRDALELSLDPHPVLPRGDGPGADQDDLITPLPEGGDIVDKLLDDREVEAFLAGQDGAADLDEDLPDIGKGLFSFHDGPSSGRAAPPSSSTEGRCGGISVMSSRSTSGTPSPVAAEKASNFTPFSVKVSISFCIPSRVVGRSSLPIATTCRFFSIAGLKSSSSRLIIS